MSTVLDQTCSSPQPGLQFIDQWVSLLNRTGGEMSDMVKSQWDPSLISVDHCVSVFPGV